MLRTKLVNFVACIATIRGNFNVIVLDFIEYPSFIVVDGVVLDRLPGKVLFESVHDFNSI